MYISEIYGDIFVNYYLIHIYYSIILLPTNVGI